MENTLINVIRNIPHLPFPIFFNAHKIYEEITNLPHPLQPYYTGLRKDVPMDVFERQENWRSLALYSISGKIESHPEEPWTGDYKPTELKQHCPYLYEVLESVGAGKLLARIEAIQPNRSVGWHSHVTEGKQPEWISVWQLPIIMPEKSKYSVISYMDYRGSTYLEPFKVYEKHYNPGQVYALNSYHYHNAFNYDAKEPMLMIRFYVDLRDPLVSELTKDAINRYTGDHIETYQEYISKLSQKAKLISL
jgi:hypothetical protein